MDGTGLNDAHADTVLMTIVCIIFALVYLAGLLVLAKGIWRAPEGFEDESGFREGRRDELADDRTL